MSLAKFIAIAILTVVAGFGYADNPGTCAEDEAGLCRDGPPPLFNTLWSTGTGAMMLKTAGTPVRPRVPRVGVKCDTGHWLVSVMDQGKRIKLEDGSIWQVNQADALDTARWLPATDILVCGNKLINGDADETITATQLR